MEEIKNNNENLTVTSAINFEVTKNERLFRFYMPMGSPLGEAYDACFEVLQRIQELSAHAVKQSASIKTDDDKSSDAKTSADAKAKAGSEEKPKGK